MQDAIDADLKHVILCTISFAYAIREVSCERGF